MKDPRDLKDLTIHDDKGRVCRRKATNPGRTRNRKLSLRTHMPAVSELGIQPRSGYLGTPHSEFICRQEILRYGKSHVGRLNGAYIISTNTIICSYRNILGS